MTISRLTATAVLLHATIAASSYGQTQNEFVQRSSFSIAAMQTRPQGALAQNIGFGYGLNGAYLFRVDNAGILSLRADVGVVAYGNESKRTPISETIGDRVQVNVRTMNFIVPVAIGPQLAWPTGVVRPYVNAGVARQYYFTESRVESVDTYDSFASTVNHSDFADSWTAGGGIYAPIVAGKVKMELDLGVQYLNGGRARYLAPGGIVDLPGGHIGVSPLESATHLLVVRLGARIGL
jgi:hypothetical protein